MTAALRPTVEQQAILDAAATGETVAISAGAGTGKTSTLRLLAEARRKTRMLYLAYNKAIQVEAERSFPANVTAKTAHALAYRAFGAPMRDRLNGPRLRGVDSAALLGIRGTFGFDAERVFPPATQAALALRMVAQFCRSADRTITARHFAPPEGLADAEAAALARHLLPVARRAWEDLTAGASGRLKPTHDVYLKQWQLSEPTLSGFDVILYDEAQDADPAIADVVEHQAHAQLLAVGDSAQAIYAWRGAGDFLQRVEATHRLQLSQSWRFGDAVADEANVWLGVIGTELRLRGAPGRASALGALEHPLAVLCRSNAGTIDALLKAHEEGTPVHLVGGGREMAALAEAALRLQEGRPAGHPELACFSTWEQLIEYAEQDPGGSDLAVGVRMIERYGAKGVLAAIEGAVSERAASLVVSTAHKAKGREWETVRVGGDFGEPLDKRTGAPLPIPRPDAMLAYVTVTRARDVLDPGGLAWVHAHLEALARPAGETVDRALTPPAADSSPGQTTEALSPIGVGTRVLVAEERGTYVVAGSAPDGSLTCHPASGQGGGTRSFRAEWCVPVERPGRNGKAVRVRSVPVAARAARAAWRRAHGLPTPAVSVPESTSVAVPGL